MPCLILTGHPCCGKTHLARMIRDRALQRAQSLDQSSEKVPSIRRVVIIDEDMACPDKSKLECYATSHDEKSTRAALKAAFDRHVGTMAKTSASGEGASSTLIILDSLNYIKGFRYELHCISKAAGEKHGVVWVLNDVNVAKEWNRQRRQDSESSRTDLNETSPSSSYTDQQMDELILRYEPPDSRNRWDHPLYRIDLRPDGVATTTNESTGKPRDLDVLERSVYNMHNLKEATIHSESTNESDKELHSSHPEKVVITTSLSGPNCSTLQRVGFKPAARPSQPNQPIQPNQASDPHDLTASRMQAMGSVDSENDHLRPSENAHTPLPLEEQIDIMLDSFLRSAKPLQEGTSTRQHVSSKSDALHDADSITQRCCTMINAAQNKSTSSSFAKIQLELQPGRPLYLSLSRRVPLTELRRLRGQYIQWVAVHPPADTSEAGIAENFLAYIEAQT